MAADVEPDKKRLTELRDLIKVKGSALDDITNHIVIREEKSAPGGKVVEVSATQRDAFRAELKDIRELREMAEEIAEAIDYKSGRIARRGEHADALGAPVGPSYAMGGVPLGADGQPVKQFKSVGEAFTASDEFKSLNSKSGVKMFEPWTFQGDLTQYAKGLGFHALEGKDVYTGMVAPTTGLGWGTIQHDPVVPQQMRTQRVRDLFPTANTSASMIQYFRVLGLVGQDANGNNIVGQYGNAGMVPERVTTGSGSAAVSTFGIKPHSALSFENDNAIVRTIAHWEAAHRNVLDDEPQLQAVINNELLYGLRLIEDYQILNGDGTGENLRGILHTPGIQTYVANTDTPVNAFNEQYSDSIRRAITRSILAYYDPSGVILHPLDWEQIELTKNTQGSYLVSTAVAIGAQKQLWRLPVVDTPAMVQGQFLVGSFGLGAQIYDRQESNIRTADQHADFFIRNAVVILAEERLALAVKRPESFVLGTFATTAVGTATGSYAAGDVGATVESLSITQQAPTLSVAAATPLQLNAVAVFPGDFSRDVEFGPGVTWSSATPAKATVNATGLVTAVAAGTSVITVTYGGHTATTTVNVTA